MLAHSPSSCELKLHIMLVLILLQLLEFARTSTTGFLAPLFELLYSAVFSSLRAYTIANRSLCFLALILVQVFRKSRRSANVRQALPSRVHGDV